MTIANISSFYIALFTYLNSRSRCDKDQRLLNTDFCRVLSEFLRIFRYFAVCSADHAAISLDSFSNSNEIDLLIHILQLVNLLHRYLKPENILDSKNIFR